MPFGLICKPRALYKNKQPTEFIIFRSLFCQVGRAIMEDIPRI